MILAPASRTETRQFHTIQLGEVYQKNVSCSPRSRLSDIDFRCSSRTPPVLWTIPLGRPVVPEENSTHSGWLNGTGRATSSEGRAGLGQPSVPGTVSDVSGGRPSRGKTIVARRVGSGAPTPRPAPRRSNPRPPYRYPSAAIRTAGSSWPRRSAAAAGEESWPHPDQTAP